MDELTELALAAGRGDRVSLATFVRQTQPEVWRLCRHLGGLATADDLSQETYVRAIAALPAFRGASSARTWLLAIARRTCADAVRRSTRRRRLDARTPAVGHQPDTTARSETELLLAGLAPDRRTAFVLTQLLGLSYAEAADVCGVPVGTIRSRVARARDDLIGELAAEEAN